MRPKLALKNIYRSWVRSVFIYILIAAVTYSLFSNVMEYAVTDRETEKAIALYDGIGTVEEEPLNAYAENQINGRYIFADNRVSMDFLPESYYERYRVQFPYQRLDSYDIKNIEELPYVTYTDKRYMTAGVSDEYYRLDQSEEYFYDFTNNYVIEATVEEYFDNEGALLISDFGFLAGEPMNNFNYDQVWVKSEPEPPEYEMPDGSKVSPEIWTNGPGIVTDKSRYDEAFCKSLVPGQRYIFIVKFAGFSRTGLFLPTFYLTDHFTYDWCDGVLSLEGEPENYLETERFEALRQYMEIVETDLHTFDVVYTQNMGSIRYFADGTMGISEGRRLSREDYLNNADVCVISHTMAGEYDLEVGDTLTLDLGNRLFEQYEGVGAIAAVPERLSDSYTEAELEIVGIFKDTRGAKIRSNDPCWSYSVNTVFVPSHLLNADPMELENHAFAPGEFSFVVENVYEAEPFIEECAGIVQSMGLELEFTDGNWKEIEETFQRSKEVAVIKMSILGVTVCAATCFTVFLYIFGRKRDFAIMRVLGASKKTARNALLLPLLTITSAAVLTGTAAAWIYTAQNISLEEALGSVQGLAIDTSVPFRLVAACVLAEIALAIGISAVILGHIGRRSPLALLQDSSQKKEKSKKLASETAEPVPCVEVSEWVSIEPLRPVGRKRTGRFIWRYIIRNIRRTKSKSLMFVIVTALLINVAGQINIMHQAYTEAFNETQVASSYAGCLNLYYINQLKESGYVRDIYYSGITSLDIDGNTRAGHITNSIERLLNSDVDITYLDGYDDSVMQRHEAVVLMDEPLMLKYDYELGDTVHIAQGNRLHFRLQQQITKYSEKHGDDFGGLTYEEVVDIVEDDAYALYLEDAQPFTIVGCVHNGRENTYLPGTMDMNGYYGQMVIMNITEAVLADNWKADEYREYGKALAAANLTDEIAFVMDTAKIEALAKNILLLEMLYPVAVAAALVIGAFLICLIIVQYSKDIAVMRVLGTSKKHIRLEIAGERMLLCFIGMVLAAVALVIMRGMTEMVLKKSALIFVLYFVSSLAASGVAASAVSGRNVLELMQTKE